MRHSGHDRAMVMAANDPFDLPVAGDDPGEFLRIPQVDPVHVGDAAGERRMMHADDGRLARRGGERAVKELSCSAFSSP